MSKVTLDVHQGPWTEEEFLALDDPLNRIELIDGSLWVTGAPHRRHQDITFKLQLLLREPALAAGLITRATVNLKLAPQRIVVPDLIVETDPDDLLLGDAATAVLACEITSPSNAAYDRGFKMQLYADAKVPWHLLIEPEFPNYQAVVLTLSRLHDKKYVVHASAKHGETLSSALPFPFEISTGYLLTL